MYYHKPFFLDYYYVLNISFVSKFPFYFHQVSLGLSWTYFLFFWIYHLLLSLSSFFSHFSFGVFVFIYFFTFFVPPVCASMEATRTHEETMIMTSLGNEYGVTDLLQAFLSLFSVSQSSSQ